MSKEFNIHQWAAQSSVIALEMVVPAIIGVGIDYLCGTAPLFVILGVFLGVAFGFWQLIKIAQSQIHCASSNVEKIEDNEPRT